MCVHSAQLETAIVPTLVVIRHQMVTTQKLLVDPTILQCILHFSGISEC